MSKSKILSFVTFFSFLLALTPKASLAQTIPSDVANLGSGTFGGISAEWQYLVNFAVNIFVYLGWAGVFVGIGFILFSLVYKLMNSDNEEAMKTVQGYITKAILIIIAGFLLLSISFLINIIANLFGISTIPTVGDVSAPKT